MHFGPNLELAEEPQFSFLKISYRRFLTLRCHALSPAMKTDGTAIETGESSAIAPKTSSKLISTFLAAAHGMQARYTIQGMRPISKMTKKNPGNQIVDPQSGSKVHSADDFHAGGGHGVT